MFHSQLFHCSMSGFDLFSNSGPRRRDKTFSCSTQLSMKFTMLINVKMQIIVGILTFISTINTFESLKARRVFIFLPFSVYILSTLTDKLS